MPVIDFHIHAYDSPVRAPESYIHFMNRALGEQYGSFENFVQSHTRPDKYLEVLDGAGVEFAVIVAELAPITSAIASNETIERLCSASPRLIPFASINPYLTAHSTRELERLVLKLGFRGLKLYPTYQQYYLNDPMLYPLYAKAQELRIPVMWHTGSSVFPASRLKYGDPLHGDDVAVDFPDLTLIMAHSGRPIWYDHAYTLARLHENVYMELAGLPPQRLLNYFPELERVADKALFGSDWPSIPTATIRGNIEIIRGLPLSEKAKEQILGANAARILRLGP